MTSQNTVIADLQALVEQLQRELENERARDIHSCGPSCSRVGCVNRRLRDDLAAIRQRSEQMFAALHVALPFVEDLEGDQCYKKGAVSKAVKTIRDAISSMEGGAE